MLKRFSRFPTSTCLSFSSYLALMLCLFLLISGCSKHKPVKIGFVGGITGRVADLGIAGRDAVILAVEEKNRQGGINGRPIKLIVKDDKNQADIAVKVDKELIAESVDAIIGHMTSSMAIAAVETINQSKTFMLSPTVSTNELSGKDDYFFRVYPQSKQTAHHLATHVYDEMKLENVFVVYDITNRAHTENAYQMFSHTFKSLGGNISGTKTFTSGPETNFTELTTDIIAAKPQCLYILANAMDTAMICLQLTKANANIRIVTSDWSATEDVLHFGGKAVEGLFFMYTIDKTSTKQRFVNFQNAFKERFGRNAGFAAVHAYDCAQILFTALEKNDDPAKLRETVKSINIFDTIQTKITFDENGDVSREHFPFTIKNGKFTRIK
jgi:branched-chain amino acid transport system substrate-binding protein